MKKVTEKKNDLKRTRYLNNYSTESISVTLHSWLNLTKKAQRKPVLPGMRYRSEILIKMNAAN